LLLFLLFWGFPTKTYGAEFRSSGNGTVAVNEGENVKNLYIAGSVVDINSNINKDLVAAGSSVNVNGNVESDLFAAGANVLSKGNIGGSARVAGGNITIDSIIGEDLLAAGNFINVSDKSVISSDLLVAGSTIDFNGTVDGNFKATGGDITLSGKINGDVSIKNVDKLIIKSDSIINGKLSYSSPNEANIETGSVIKGGIDYSKSESAKSVSDTLFWQTLIYKVLASLLLILLLIYIFPKFSKTIVESTYASFFPHFSYGLLTLIMVPIMVILLIIFVITGSIAAIAGLLYILYLILASAFVGLLLGSLVMKLIDRSQEYKINWIAAIVGVLLVMILSLIEIAGPIIIFVFFLTALGTLVTTTWKAIEKNR